MADDKKIIFSMVGVSKAFQANKQVLTHSQVFVPGCCPTSP